MPRGRSPAAAPGDAAGAGFQPLPTGRASSGMLRVPSASSVLSSLHEESKWEAEGGWRPVSRERQQLHRMERDGSMVSLLNLLDPGSLADAAPARALPAEPQTPGSPGRCEQHSALSLRGLALVGALSACGWYGLRLVLRDYIGGRRGGRRELALELHALSTMHALGWLAFILSKLRGPSEELPRYCSRALVASLGFYLHDCWELRGTLLANPQMLLHQASIAATIAAILRSKGVAWLGVPLMSLSVPTLAQELLLLSATAGVPASRPEVRGLRLLWFASFAASKLALLPLWWRYRDSPELHQPALLSGKVSYLCGLALNLRFISAAARDLPMYLLKPRGAGTPAIAEAYRVPLGAVRSAGTAVAASAVLSSIFLLYAAGPAGALLALLAFRRGGRHRPLRHAAFAVCCGLALDQFLPMPRECSPRVRWLLPLVRLLNRAFGHRFYPRNKIELKKDRHYMLALTPHGFMPWGVVGVMAELWDQGYLPNFVGASVLGALPFAGRALRFAGYTPATRESIRRCLDRPYPRNVTLIIPGGIHEMFLGRPDVEVTAAGMRKGFAALAAEKEAMLVPGYMFGTSQLYTVAGGWLGDLFEQLSRRLRMSITLFHGRWGTLLPHPHPLACALGEPVDTREVRDAGDAHALWCARLRAAYEEHRGDFGWAGRPLFFEGEDALPPPPRDPLESYTALPRLSKL